MFRVVARVLAISALATVALAADDLSQLDAEYAAQKAALLAKGSQARANAQPSISTDNGKVVITASDIAFKIGGTTITMNEMAKQAQLDSLDKATRGAVLALLNNVTVLDERQRRTSAEIGGSLKGELTKLGGAQETQFKKADSKIDSVIATLKKQDTAAVALKAAVADTKPMAKIIDTAMVTLKNFMKLNSVCATKGLVYDEKEKKCKCDAGYIYTGSNCILEPGTKTNPAKDCAAIKMMYDGAKDGKFWLKPGKNAVEAYCDMTTDGGGWTLIESYDLYTLKQTYKHKPFVADFPRNKDKPPASKDAKDANWKDYRLAKTEMAALMDRSSQVHARCHRDMSKSTGDWLIGDITMILWYYSGFGTKPYSNKPYHPLSSKGKIRGYSLSTRDLKWYNMNPYHPGFDVGGNQVPGSTASEDSFTFHDGALNSKHVCHTKAGDTTWWVRGGGTVGTPETPAHSCQHALLASGSKLKSRNGPYWLKMKTRTTRVFCDMTSHGGGWTMFNKLNRGQQANSMATNHQLGTNNYDCMNIARAHTGRAMNCRLKGDDINYIRNSWTTWGKEYGYTPSDSDTTYWTMTPGQGEGLFGAENFHRQDCSFASARSSSAIKTGQCHWNKWIYSDTAWSSGGHWHDNSACYYSWSAYANEYDRGTGGRCFPTGRGLGYHCGGHSPFHRGWCSSSRWGLEWVR